MFILLMIMCAVVSAESRAIDMANRNFVIKERIFITRITQVLVTVNDNNIIWQRRYDAVTIVKFDKASIIDVSLDHT